ncbi:glycosyltransferase family 2 protein [Patescibacteria group bacterium]|nr:MAG: glycosyltransferase family 2 protein [Patescibacteria group bacterium]
MICIVVPAYNEEKKIGRVVRGLFEHGFENVVVVDDGSDDRTAEEALAAGATVLRHELNRGQGAALQTGNEYALARGAEMAVHFDADAQHNPADIGPATETLRQSGADILLGSRFLDNRSKMPWFKKHVLLPVGRWINYVFTGLKLSDAHNGFRILTRRALEKLNITQDRMAHNTELVAQIKKHGLKHIEFPVEVTYHEYGQRAGDGFKIIGELLLESFGRKKM